MKYLLATLGLLVLIFLTYLGYQNYSQARQDVFELNQKLIIAKDKVDTAQELRTNLENLEKEFSEKEEQEKIYTIQAVGDIMMDRGVEAQLKRLGVDYNFSFDLIREDLLNADLVFANLEGSISDVGIDTGKAYSFRFEPAVANALSDAGIDIVSLANNHMMDWGRESICETTKHLDSVGIKYVGAGCDSDQAERPMVLKLGNTNIAFLAYTEFYVGAHATQDRAGMSEYDMEKITQRITELQQNPDIDIILVSMHWGEEYKHRATGNQVDNGRQLIDAGADVVIGHHPHVDQEIERYGQGWIIYSLGNFIFDQDWSTETMQGLLAEIQIQNKRVYDIVPKTIQLNNNYQPEIVE